MSIWNTIAQGAMQLGTTLIGVNAARKENKKERDFNAQQAQLDRDFQREERLATQEYNSVSSQIDRMLEAGVNPLSAFSNGYTSAESTPSSGSAASYSSSLGSSILSASSQQALTLAQIDKIEAETENTKADTVNMTKRTAAEIDKIYSDIGMNDYSKDIQERTFQFFAKKSDAELKVMNEQLNLLRNQSLDILKGIDLKDANIKDLLASASLKEKQGDLVESQTEGQKINNDLLEIQKKFSDITGVPLGASEEQALFALWTQGRWQEMSERISLNSYNSDNPISKAAGAAGTLFNKIGRTIESIFTK